MSVPLMSLVDARSDGEEGETSSEANQKTIRGDDDNVKKYEEEIQPHEVAKTNGLRIRQRARSPFFLSDVDSLKNTSPVAIKS